MREGVGGGGRASKGSNEVHTEHREGSRLRLTASGRSAKAPRSMAEPASLSGVFVALRVNPYGANTQGMAAQDVRPPGDKDRDGNIYEWDYLRGRVEKYNPRGNQHLGDFDHRTGKQISGPDVARRPVEP